MLIVPITVSRLQKGDDLVALIQPHVQDGDIVVVSSKAIATIEGAAINLQNITPADEAMAYAEKCQQHPAFTQAVLDETKRLNGEVVGTCPWALLTSVKPKGVRGRLLCPNAGLDQSNVEPGHAIGWPLNPLQSTVDLQKALGNVAVILSDSGCRPSRLGVTAIALTVSGLDPFQSEAGKEDLFGTKLKFTQEAVADQLATAANAVMGNAGQSIPAAIIRDHQYQLSDFNGWIDGISRDDDLFQDILKG